MKRHFRPDGERQAAGILLAAVFTVGFVVGTTGSNVRAEMTLIGIAIPHHIALAYSLLQQPSRATLEQRSQHRLGARIERLPYLIQRPLNNIAHNNPAARTAEDIPERIDVDVLGPEQIALAILAA